MAEPGDPDGHFLEVITSTLLGHFPEGVMVDGFVLVASYRDADGDPQLYMDTMTGQTATSALGLLQAGLIRERVQMERYFTEDDDDGD